MPMGVKTASTPNRMISSRRRMPVISARAGGFMTVMTGVWGRGADGARTRDAGRLCQRQGGGQDLVEIVLGGDIELGRRLDLVCHYHVEFRHHGDELPEGAAGGIGAFQG